MPQMAPLNWLSLMLLFISIMILFNIMNFYSFKYTLNQDKIKQIKKLNITWKW